MEKHLSQRTNELFDLEDKILIYDLTNIYFEGQKRGSKIAKFGRSKEKRNDAKIVVLVRQLADGKQGGIFKILKYFSREYG